MPETILTTARLRIVPFEEADFPLLFDLHSDPEVNRYLSPGLAPMSEVEVCRRLNDYIGDHKRLGISKWKLETLEGEFAGRAGFSRLDDPDGFELSYSLKRKAWGNGYATEIACGLVAWFFRKTSEPYLMAYAVSEHGASQRVMIKAGLFYWYEMEKYGVPCRFYRVERKDFERFSSAGAKPADELVN